MNAAELEVAARDAAESEQVAAAERLVSVNPEWRLALASDPPFNYALTHLGTGARALLYGKYWQGPTRPDETGDIPLFRSPENALRALGFNVA